MRAQSCFWGENTTSGRQQERPPFGPSTSAGAAGRSALDLSFGSGRTSALSFSERDPGSSPDLLAALSTSIASPQRALADPSALRQSIQSSSAYSSSAFGAPGTEFGPGRRVGGGVRGAHGPDQEMGAAMRDSAARFLDSTAAYEAANGQYAASSYSRLSSSSSSLAFSIATPPQSQTQSQPATLSQALFPTQVFQQSTSSIGPHSQLQPSGFSNSSFFTHQPSGTQQNQQQQQRMNVFAPSFANISSVSAQNSAYDSSTLSQTPPAFPNALSQLASAPPALFGASELLASAGGPVQQQQAMAGATQLTGSSAFSAAVLQPSPPISLSSYTWGGSGDLRALHQSSGLQAAAASSMEHSGAMAVPHAESWLQQRSQMGYEAQKQQQQASPPARALPDPLRMQQQQQLQLPPPAERLLGGSPNAAVRTNVTQPAAFNVSAASFVCVTSSLMKLAK